MTLNKQEARPAIFTIERDILQYGLLIGAGFQLYQSLLSLLPGVQWQTIAINWGLTVVLLICFYLSRNIKYARPVTVVLHFVAIGGFFFFWSNFGGLAGTVPSFFCFYVIFVVIVSHGAIRWFFLILIFVVLVVFFANPALIGMTDYVEHGKVDPVQLGIDFFLIAVIIALFTLSMKKRLMYHHSKVLKRQSQLSNVAETLASQNAKLEAHHEEINVINENLESIVRMRTLEIMDKNRSLSEYAFINAHMLRGPLCRIIGLLTLMEYEKNDANLEQLHVVKNLALDIDHKIQRINEVLS